MQAGNVNVLHCTTTHVYTKSITLDEATSALDVHNKENIETFIFELVQQGLAVVWITHDDQQSTRHFDKQWRIVDGKLQSEEVLT